MGVKNNLSFSNKKHSERGSFSLFLGCMSIIACITLVVLSYSKEGKAGSYIGSCGIVAMVTALLGFCFGIAGFWEEERRRLLVVAGVLLNLFLLVIWIGLFVVGM